MKLKKTIIAAALAAAALAPGLALAAAPAKGCLHEPDSEAFLDCAAALIGGPKLSSDAAVDAYLAKLVSGLNGREELMLKAHNRGWTITTAPMRGERAAAEVATPAAIEALPLTPYRKHVLLECAQSGIGLSYFIYTAGCNDTALRDIALLGPVAILLDPPKSLETASPGLVPQIRRDALAAGHTLAVSRPGLEGLVPNGVVDQAAIKAGSQSLRRLLARDFPDADALVEGLNAYFTDLQREQAGLPLHDWRAPMPGMR